MLQVVAASHLSRLALLPLHHPAPRAAVLQPFASSASTLHFRDGVVSRCPTRFCCRRFWRGPGLRRATCSAGGADCRSAGPGRRSPGDSSGSTRSPAPAPFGSECCTWRKPGGNRLACGRSSPGARESHGTLRLAAGANELGRESLGRRRHRDRGRGHTETEDTTRTRARRPLAVDDRDARRPCTDSLADYLSRRQCSCPSTQLPGKRIDPRRRKYPRRSTQTATEPRRDICV